MENNVGVIKKHFGRAQQAPNIRHLISSDAYQNRFICLIAHLRQLELMFRSMPLLRAKTALFSKRGIVVLTLNATAGFSHEAGICSGYSIQICHDARMISRLPPDLNSSRIPVAHFPMNTKHLEARSTELCPE